jgi:hypothetical protein
MEESMAEFLLSTLLGGRLRAAQRKLWAWVDLNVIDLGRQMRLSHLPPLMVYMAAGISGLTAIVGTFFVKGYSFVRGFRDIPCVLGPSELTI